MKDLIPSSERKDFSEPLIMQMSENNLLYSFIQFSYSFLQDDSFIRQNYI